MGFSLARVLRDVDAEAVVDGVALIPEVVEWNRGMLADLAGKLLLDARVRVSTGDVAEAILAATALYDIVHLDVDNGPDALVHSGNQRLHGHPGSRPPRRPCVPAVRWRSGRRPTARRSSTGCALQPSPSPRTTPARAGA